MPEPSWEVRSSQSETHQRVFAGELVIGGHALIQVQQPVDPHNSNCFVPDICLVLPRSVAYLQNLEHVVVLTVGI
jgi:hypothetical protein